jgi:hypothetical protein
MKLAVGFLLNVWLVFAEASNRNERRQKAKTGSFRRQS